MNHVGAILFFFHRGIETLVTFENMERNQENGIGGKAKRKRRPPTSHLVIIVETRERMLRVLDTF